MKALAFVVFVASGCAHVDVGGAAEVDGGHGVEGFRSAHALFYVVPVGDDGVVLVDTGFDESGVDLKNALRGRRVRAVLITHAHIDHWAGTATLGDDVVVYAGADDVLAMQGKREHRALLQQLITHLLPQPKLPAHLHGVEDGAVVDVDGEVFVARHLPGHTAGSVVWLWRDVAFTGDAFSGDGDSVGFAPPILSDDDAEARRSIARLWGIDASVLLDGHGGRTDDAAAHLQRFLADGGAR